MHVPGGALHVVDDGAGRPVVLLHAGVADSRSWDGMVPFLLDAGLRVVRYDARGYGRSRTDDVEFSNVEDLVAVLDHLGISRALLVGNSRGGLIAINAALDVPERVVGVVGVAAALGGFTGTSTPLEEALFEELERLEESIFRTTPTRASIEAFYDLKHEVMALKHAVAPLMEVAGKLYGGRVPALCSGLGEYFRDVYDHLQRVNAAIENMREMLQTAISVSFTLINLAESETTKRLAAWGALITIPTLIAGIYGMNFEHMPELRWVFGYPLALGLMAAVDGYLIYRFRKAGWL